MGTLGLHDHFFVHKLKIRGNLMGTLGLHDHFFVHKLKTKGNLMGTLGSSVRHKLNY